MMTLYMKLLLVSMHVSLVVAGDDNTTLGFNSPPQQCGRNEVWTNCASSTCFERNCSTVPTNVCSRDCKRGCKCQPGFARSAQGRCINETLCPPIAPHCGEGEVWTPCTSSGCFERRCDTPQPVDCPSDCKMGCRCKEGYARLADRCVNITTCPSSRGSAPSSSSSSSFSSPPTPCPQHEVFTQCSSSSCFERRCDTTPTDICSRDCRRGCKCEDGYARQGNTCILLSSCPPSSSPSFDPGFRSLVLPGTKTNTTNTTQKTNTTQQPTKQTQPTSAPSNKKPIFLSGAKLAKAQQHKSGNRTLFVGPKRENCTQGQGLCLLTRYTKQVPYVRIVKEIKGFEYRGGFVWELAVRSQIRGAKGLLVEYELLKIVNKTRHPILIEDGLNCSFPLLWTWAQQTRCCAAYPNVPKCKNSTTQTGFVSPPTPKPKAKARRRR